MCRYSGAAHTHTHTCHLYSEIQKKINITKKYIFILLHGQAGDHCGATLNFTSCLETKMAASSAVLSMSKIIKPLLGGRLGNTVKVRICICYAFLSPSKAELDVQKQICFSGYKVIWLTAS